MHIRRTSRLRLGVSAKALAKFWRLIGCWKYFFLFTIIKSRPVAFQPCITLGGVHWVEMGQRNDFLQKSGLKTPILAVMVLDQLTSEWAGTQHFKGIANLNMCVWQISNISFEMSIIWHILRFHKTHWQYIRSNLKSKTDKSLKFGAYSYWNPDWEIFVDP